MLELELSYKAIEGAFHFMGIPSPLGIGDVVERDSTPFLGIVVIENLELWEFEWRAILEM